MPYQIIKQPDGAYSIFSSVSDVFCMIDADAAEVEQFFVDIAIADAKRNVARALEMINTGQHHSGAMTWKEAWEEHRRHARQQIDDQEFCDDVEKLAGKLLAANGSDSNRKSP